MTDLTVPTLSLSSSVYDILPDLCSYLYDIEQNVHYDSLPALEQAKVLTDILLDFGTFSPDCDPEAVAYVAALRYVGLVH